MRYLQKKNLVKKSAYKSIFTNVHENNKLSVLPLALYCRFRKKETIARNPAKTEQQRVFPEQGTGSRVSVGCFFLSALSVCGDSLLLLPIKFSQSRFSHAQQN